MRCLLTIGVNVTVQGRSKKDRGWRMIACKLGMLAVVALATKNGPDCLSTDGAGRNYKAPAGDAIVVHARVVASVGQTKDNTA